MIDDIPAFLSENWALALYHDKFSQLVIKLKAILHEKDIRTIVSEVIGQNKPLNRITVNEILGKVNKSTKAKIEFEIVNFLNENKNHLPFYFIPMIQPIEDNENENERNEGNENEGGESGKENNENNENNVKDEEGNNNDKNSKEGSRHSSAEGVKAEA